MLADPSGCHRQPAVPRPGPVQERDASITLREQKLAEEREAFDTALAEQQAAAEETRTALVAEVEGVRAEVGHMRVTGARAVGQRLRGSPLGVGLSTSRPCRERGSGMIWLWSPCPTGCGADT